MFRFASRSAFSRYAVEPRRLERPGADERLVDEQLLRPVGASPVAERRVQLVPAADALAPTRSAIPASAPIRARTSALRFESCVEPASSARGKRAARSAFARWNSVDGDPEAARVGADLVQREQPHVAVEGRVLDALRHHRAGRLLEARDELVVAALLEEEHAPQLLGQAGERGAVGVLDAAGPRLDVRAVDRQRRERGLEVGHVEQAAEPLDLGLERRRRLLELRLGRDDVPRRAARPRARSAPPRRPGRRRAPRASAANS